MSKRRSEVINGRIREKLLSAYRAARRSDPAFAKNAAMLHKGRLLYLWSRMDLGNPDLLQRVFLLAIGLRGDLSVAFGGEVRDEYRATVRHYLNAVESLIETISEAADEVYDSEYPGDFGESLSPGEKRC